MKYIFFGTPEFAAIILEKLINAGFIPEAVVCNPDKPVGRKKIVTPPPTKILAEKYNISVLQPESLEIRNWKLEIDKLSGVDLAIVASYGKIIPKTILDSLPAKFIGIHPSLLPKYRGPSPIQNAILNGDKETGVSLYLMDEKVDHGAILATIRLPIATNDNYELLMKKLAGLSAQLLIETLPKFVKNEIAPRPQDNNQATFTKKFVTEDGYIKPEDLETAQQQGGEISLEIDRKIRALNPEPGTYTINPPAGENKRMKILEAVLTHENKLKLKKIQFEGKKPTEYQKL